MASIKMLLSSSVSEAAIHSKDVVLLLFISFIVLPIVSWDTLFDPYFVLKDLV